MNYISILLSILSSETIKVLVKKATTALFERTDTSIDPDLAEALLKDIASSDGNNITVESIENLIKELKS